MTPTTRFRSKPHRQVGYTDQDKRSRIHKTHICQTNLNAALALRTHNPGPFATAAGVNKLAVKLQSKPKLVPRPKARDCKICARKKPPVSFGKLGEAVCGHFMDICRDCVEKMVRTKMVDGTLDVAELACPYSECTYVMGFEEAKKLVSRALFEK
ncbi:uncharacterized protein BDR25DRAFT_309707 [Lindgomyces ingoldianus]|uniref:Uncharacterized protein n=1 Tax=Lindgomyces ingoldianus TaxID=673940 RepID=A0ACB6RAX6_9PLEO|nr:uncharacterized protein BDR25DRAFT_309707 [Lindgomyces ingoldianus]KAF2476291.1 hypothetical protein BDR25DRAFT_309707 [Lindgomyces ingoldianus]